MCLAMNADKLGRGEHCASTSNRNFEGRQGFGGRTHLVSPAMAAAAAVPATSSTCGAAERVRQETLRMNLPHEGLVAPMDRANVDTDLIIPSSSSSRSSAPASAPNLFDELRYLDEGQPGRTAPGGP
jgi:hypothetical protein